LQGFHLVLCELQLTLVELSIVLKFKVADTKNIIVHNFNEAQQNNFLNTVYHTYPAHLSLWLLSVCLSVLITVMLQKIQAAFATL
jgi:hypothetical protein